jgi:hypothetical protein
MDKKVTFALDNPTSAFTKFVRAEKIHTECTKEDRTKRKTAFARIKQLFKIQSCELEQT